MTVTIQDKPIVIPESVRRKAGLRRGDRVEFKVSGRSITIVPKEPAEDDLSLERIMHMMEDAKKNPMTPRQARAEAKSLSAYGARQAKKLGIKESDIPRIVHEFRARQRSS